MAVGDFIVSIEKFTLNLNNLTSVSADLTLGQVSANCVIWALTAERVAGSDQARRHQLDAFITAGSPPTVTVARALSEASDLFVELTVVEFDSNEVDVQQGTFEADNVTSDDVTIDTLVINDSMLWCWYDSTSGSDDADEQEIFCEFDSTTNIHFEMQVTSGGTIAGHWFVATAIGSTKAFSVQHLATTDTEDDGETESQTLGTTVTLSLSIGYGSHASLEPADDARDFAWDNSLSTGSLDWARGDGATTADGGKILRGWVASFNVDAGINVQRGELDYDNNLTENATITAVGDIDNSFVMSSTRSGTTQSNSTGNSGRGAAANTLELTTTTNVLGTVGGTDGTKTAFFQVIETQLSDDGITGSVNETLVDVSISIAGVVSNIGSVAETLGDTTLAASGVVGDPVTGSVNETLADSILSASGIVSNIGSVSEILEDTELSASGTVSNIGSVSEILGDTTLSASGVVGDPVIGSVNEVLEDTELSASGTVSNIGSVSQILEDTELSALGEVSNIGFLSEILEDTELSASALVSNIGSVAETLDDTTLAASGLVNVIGSVLEVLEDTELSASGLVNVIGALSETLEDSSLSANGLVSVIGQLSEILQDTELLASGFVGVESLQGRLKNAVRIGLMNRHGNIDLINRKSTIDLVNRSALIEGD